MSRELMSLAVVARNGVVGVQEYIGKDVDFRTFKLEDEDMSFVGYLLAMSDTLDYAMQLKCDVEIHLTKFVRQTVGNVNTLFAWSKGSYKNGTGISPRLQSASKEYLKLLLDAERAGIKVTTKVQREGEQASTLLQLCWGELNAIIPPEMKEEVSLEDKKTSVVRNSRMAKETEFKMDDVDISVVEGIC